MATESVIKQGRGREAVAGREGTMSERGIGMMGKREGWVELGPLWLSPEPSSREPLVNLWLSGAQRWSR